MGITDELANWVLRINALCAEKDAEIERLSAIEKAARLAHDYHLRGYGSGADFDANTQLDLMNALGRALEGK
jgi:hypothetical protein